MSLSFYYLKRSRPLLFLKDPHTSPRELGLPNEPLLRLIHQHQSRLEKTNPLCSSEASLTLGRELAALRITKANATDAEVFSRRKLLRFV